MNALRDVIEDMGNPFTEQNDELVILDTKEVVENEVADEVLGLAVLGQAQYYQFIQEQLVAKTKSIDDPIKCNKITLLKKSMGASKAKEKQKVSGLRNDCSLFSRLYVSCQIRSGNLEDFFQHENQVFPPSLSQAGLMNKGIKVGRLFGGV